MGLTQRDLQGMAKLGQAITIGVGQQHRGEFKGIQHWSLKVNAGGAQKTHVKTGIVGNDRCYIGADKGQQLRRNGRQGGRFDHVTMADAGQLLNAQRDRTSRVDKGNKLVKNPVTLETHGADLDDLIPFWIKPRCFQVERDEHTRCHQTVSVLHHKHVPTRDTRKSWCEAILPYYSRFCKKTTTECRM